MALHEMKEPYPLHTFRVDHNLSIHATKVIYGD